MVPGALTSVTPLLTCSAEAEMMVLISLAALAATSASAFCLASAIIFSA